MPRFFIIAATSGGIFGALLICMVEVMVHSPTLPWAARAAPGARRQATATPAQACLKCMSVLTGFSPCESDRTAARVNCRSILVLGNEGPRTPAISPGPVGREDAAH